MINAINAKTNELEAKGLTNRNAVSQALCNAVMENRNRNANMIMEQQAILMLAEFYNGSREYC